MLVVPLPELRSYPSMAMQQEQQYTIIKEVKTQQLWRMICIYKLVSTQDLLGMQLVCC
jgi:hypothetical protein